MSRTALSPRALCKRSSFHDGNFITSMIPLVGLRCMHMPYACHGRVIPIQYRAAISRVHQYANRSLSRANTRSIIILFIECNQFTVIATDNSFGVLFAQRLIALSYPYCAINPCNARADIAHHSPIARQFAHQICATVAVPVSAAAQFARRCLDPSRQTTVCPYPNNKSF